MTATTGPNRNSKDATPSKRAFSGGDCVQRSGTLLARAAATHSRTVAGIRNQPMVAPPITLMRPSKATAVHRVRVTHGCVRVSSGSPAMPNGISRPGLASHASATTPQTNATHTKLATTKLNAGASGLFEGGRVPRWLNNIVPTTDHRTVCRCGTIPFCFLRPNGIRPTRNDART